LPLFKEIDKNSKDLVLAKNDIVDLNAQINETNNFKKNYEIYKPNLEKIDGLFIDIKNPVSFIKFLENTASNSQVTSKISLPVSPLNSQQFITFQLVSKGSFSNMLKFIKEIELSNYLIEIESLNIQNLNRDPQIKDITNDYSFRDIEATFTIKAFIKK
jgi:hypothetical protein